MMVNAKKWNNCLGDVAVISFRVPFRFLYVSSLTRENSKEDLQKKGEEENGLE